MTVRAKYHFTVKESPSGTPWICFEPSESELKGEGLPKGIYGFELYPGKSLKDVEKFAMLLDAHIEYFNFTKF